MSFLNLRSKERREPMARPVWPRVRIDGQGIRHIELSNPTTVRSIEYTTISDGVRLVYDSVGRLIGVDISAVDV